MATGTKPTAKPNSSNGKTSFDGRRLLDEITQSAPWELWAEKLSSGKHTQPLHKLVPADCGPPLVWSLRESSSAEAVYLVGELGKLRRKRRADEPADWNGIVASWLESISQSPLNLDGTLEYIAWASVLDRLAPRLTGEHWVALFGYLMETAVQAAHGSTLDVQQDDPETLLRDQMLAVELPLMLGHVLPKIDACQDAWKTGRRNFASSLIDLTDGEGMVHAKLWSSYQYLLASWTRCALLCRYANSEISDDARMQLDWVVRQSLRWRRPDGSFMLETGTQSQLSSNQLMQTLVSAFGDRADKAVLRLQQRNETSSLVESLDEAGEHYEWSNLALLRSNWSNDADILGIDFSRQQIRIELIAGQRRILHGADQFSIIVDGKLLSPESSWSENCWVSDDDVDFVELELQLSQGWTLQRQWIVSRSDHYAYSADALIGPQPSAVEYSRTLPLAKGVRTKDNPDTRELILRSGKRLGMLVPLGLCEWRADNRLGRFSEGRLSQRTDEATALYAPVFIDLCPKRSRKANTWRQLTVAEKRQIVTDAQAVAYRWQIGGDQWLAYRSLTPVTNRTFMGQNHNSEFVFGRFEDAELDPLVEVE
ncbi:MAG: hypothetical protein KDA87_19730 [Planctomycetales bacterium]|nr:hypothetical protein [Planctomycetales bacterium]